MTTDLSEASRKTISMLSSLALGGNGLPPLVEIESDEDGWVRFRVENATHSAWVLIPGDAAERTVVSARTLGDVLAVAEGDVTLRVEKTTRDTIIEAKSGTGVRHSRSSLRSYGVPSKRESAEETRIVATLDGESLADLIGTAPTVPVGANLPRVDLTLVAKAGGVTGMGGFGGAVATAKLGEADGEWFLSVPSDAAKALAKMDGETRVHASGTAVIVEDGCLFVQFSLESSLNLLARVEERIAEAPSTLETTLVSELISATKVLLPGCRSKEGGGFSMRMFSRGGLLIMEVGDEGQEFSVETVQYDGPHIGSYDPRLILNALLRVAGSQAIWLKWDTGSLAIGCDGIVTLVAGVADK